MIALIGQWLLRKREKSDSKIRYWCSGIVDPTSHDISKHRRIRSKVFPSRIFPQRLASRVRYNLSCWLRISLPRCRELSQQNIQIRVLRIFSVPYTNYPKVGERKVMTQNDITIALSLVGRKILCISIEEPKGSRLLRMILDDGRKIDVGVSGNLDDEAFF